MSANSTKSPDFRLIKPPERTETSQPSVILYGSMDFSETSPKWHDDLAESLSDLPVAVIDPRNVEWSDDWKEDINYPPFTEQVDWEFDYGDSADVIVVNYVQERPSPIALLELGLRAATGKVIICCPRSFYKRGNIEVVSRRFGIPLVETLDELKEKVRKQLESLLQEKSERASDKL